MSRLITSHANDQDETLDREACAALLRTSRVPYQAYTEQVAAEVSKPIGLI